MMEIQYYPNYPKLGKGTARVFATSLRGDTICELYLITGDPLTEIDLLLHTLGLRRAEKWKDFIPKDGDLHARLRRTRSKQP